MAFPDNADPYFTQKAYSGFVSRDFWNKKREQNGASNLVASSSFCSHFTNSDFMIIQPQLGLRLLMCC